MPSEFSLISDIDIANDNHWQKKIFITLDIDWCHDDVLSHSIDIIEKFDICATWFVTHETPLLQRLKENKKFELGIHPNFNGLLDGIPHNYGNGDNARAVIDKILSIVPDAKSVRSHAMTQNSHLLSSFAEFGLTHDCNHFIPAQAEMHLKPWLLWNDLIKVPYFWEDDIACTYFPNNIEKFSVATLIQNKGLKVFDFHPIHLFLNSQNMNLYNEVRTIHHNPAELSKCINPNYGTCDFLKELAGGI